MVQMYIEELMASIERMSEKHILFKAYAKQAKSELKHNLARLFDALSFSKEIQALSLLGLTGQVNDTLGNIEECLKGPIAVKAESDEQLAEAASLNEKFNKIEEKNRHLYLCAKDTLKAHKDLNIGDINVCSKCGYTLPGDAPQECIICRAPSGYFRIF